MILSRISKWFDVENLAQLTPTQKGLITLTCKFEMKGDKCNVAAGTEFNYNPDKDNFESTDGYIYDSLYDLIGIEQNFNVTIN